MGHDDPEITSCGDFLESSVVDVQYFLPLNELARLVMTGTEAGSHAPLGVTDSADGDVEFEKSHEKFLNFSPRQAVVRYKYSHKSHEFGAEHKSRNPRGEFSTDSPTGGIATSKYLVFGDFNTPTGRKLDDIVDLKSFYCETRLGLDFFSATRRLTDDYSVDLLAWKKGSETTFVAFLTAFLTFLPFVFRRPYALVPAFVRRRGHGRVARIHAQSPSQFVVLSAELLVFGAELLVLDSKLLVFDSKLLVFDSELLVFDSKLFMFDFNCSDFLRQVSDETLEGHWNRFEVDFFELIGRHTDFRSQRSLIVDPRSDNDLKLMYDIRDLDRFPFYSDVSLGVNSYPQSTDSTSRTAMLDACADASS